MVPEETPPAPPAPESEAPESLTTEQLEDMFVFDPMEEKEPVEEPPADGEPPAEPPAPKEPPKEPVAPTTPPPAEPAPAPVETATEKLLKEIQAENRQMRQEIAALRQAPPPAAPPKPAEPAPERPVFGLRIPKQIRELLESEDGEQRGAALENVINGALEVAYRHTMSKVEERLAEVGRQIPTTVNSMAEAKEQDQKVHDEFYTLYPGYNKPELKIFIAGVAQRVAAERNAQTWNAELRDAVGKRLAEILGFDGKAPSAPPPDNGAPPADPPRAGGPKRVPSGARPPAGPAADTQEAFMADLL